MRLRRDTLLVAGLVILLVVLTIAATLYQSRAEEVPALSSTSNNPDGARALALWLEQLGYEVDNQVSTSFEGFAIPQNAQAVLILEPTAANPITETDWEVLEPWVSQGGWLLITSSNARFGTGENPLQIRRTVLSGDTYTIAPAAPVFRAPPLAQPARLKLDWWLTTERNDGLPLLAVEEGPIAWEFRQGRGRILAISNSAFLSNAGLKESANAALALNLLSGLKPGSRVWFDEWHHGQRSGTNPAATGPETWLLTTPSGRALLFAAFVIVLGLALSGRHFGRPVPLPEERVRRAPLEYVTALANLSRRAGHRRALMQYYRESLKRAFGRRYRLDASLPDEAFVAQLARFKPDLNVQDLLDLLKRLNYSHYSEPQMVSLARETAQWLKDFER